MTCLVRPGWTGARLSDTTRHTGVHGGRPALSDEPNAIVPEKIEIDTGEGVGFRSVIDLLVEHVDGSAPAMVKRRVMVFKCPCAGLDPRIRSLKQRRFSEVPGLDDRAE